MTAPQALLPGMVLGRENDNNPAPKGHPDWSQSLVEYDGFCGGEFGRDGYELKRVEVVAADYVVCRNALGQPEFYSGDPADLLGYVLPVWVMR